MIDEPIRSLFKQPFKPPRWEWSCSCCGNLRVTSQKPEQVIWCTTCDGTSENHIPTARWDEHWSVLALIASLDQMAAYAAWDNDGPAQVVNIASSLGLNPDRPR